MRVLLTTLTMVVLSATAGLGADAKAGEAVYAKSCKGCHGPDGTPSATMAKMMKVDIKDMKSHEIQEMSDADLKKVMAEGKGKMKPVTAVSGAAADNVAAYIHSLKK